MLRATTPAAWIPRLLDGRWLQIAGVLAGAVAAAGLARMVNASPWVAGLATGVALALSIVLPSRVLQKAGAPELAAWRGWDGPAWLALIAAAVMAWMAPGPLPEGTPASPLSVAGSVRFPGMGHFVKLSFAQYGYLLAAGAAFLICGFIRLWVWLRALARVVPGAGDRIAGKWLFLTALAAGLWLQGWPAAVYPATGDEVHYLLMADSLKQEGTLDLKRTFAEQRWREVYPGASLDFHGHPDRQGRWISRHMPGLSVVILPGYALLGRWGASAVNLALAAWALLLLYGLARDLGAKPGQAFFMYAVALVSAPWSMYGYLLYPVAMGMFLTTASGRVLARPAQPASGWLLGIFLGLLPWFHQGFASLSLALAGVAVWLWARRQAWKAIAGLLASGAAFGLLFTWVFFRFYHQAFQAGDYAFGLRPGFFLSACLGLAVDRYYGALLAAPVLLAGAAGLIRLGRSRGPEALMIWACLGASVLTAALFVDWTGFSASFPRLIAPAGFLLFAGLAFFPLRPGTAACRFVLGTAAAAGLVSLAAWILPPLLYELPRERIFRVLGSHHVPPFWKLAPSLSHEPGTWALLHAAGLWLIGAGVVVWLLRGSREGDA